MYDKSKYPAWEKLKSDLKKTLGLAFAVLCVLGVISFVSVYGVSYRGWIAFTNGVDVENVYIEPEPHDCDWDSAPLGSKHCHYQSHVIQTYGQGNHVDDRKIKIAVEWEKVSE